MQVWLWHNKKVD